MSSKHISVGGIAFLFGVGIFIMNNQEEIWKDIPNYEGLYQVSNLGRVKSFKSNKETILKGTVGKQGYLIVGLHSNCKQKTKSIHKLVAMAFLNHVPCGYKLVVDHINNIKTDNRVENLQVITQRENTSKDRSGYSSKYVGVSWHKKMNKWYSLITINGKSKNLGYFINEVDARNAYQKKLKEILSQKH